MSDLNLSFDDYFPEDFLISGFFGDDYASIIEEIIQVIVARPSTTWFPDELLEELGNYLSYSPLYLSKQATQYLQSESFKLSESKLSRLISTINKLREDKKIKFRTESNYLIERI